MIIIQLVYLVNYFMIVKLIRNLHSMEFLLNLFKYICYYFHLLILYLLNSLLSGECLFIYFLLKLFDHFK